MRSSAGPTFQLGMVTAVVGVATLHARVVAPERYDALGVWEGVEEDPLPH